MAVVTVNRTYDFTVNQLLEPPNDVYQDYERYAIWSIKDMLVNYPHNPWTVLWSCDKTNVGATDYWTDYTKLNWNTGGNPHSWIVLASSAGGQLLIECGGNRPDYISLACSNEGLYVGPGSTTAPPAAVDQNNLITFYAQWRNIMYYTSPPMILHGVHSIDGEVDHIILTSRGVPFLYWAKQTVQYPVTNYNLNNIFFGHTNNNITSSRMGYGSHTEQQYWKGKKSASGDGTGLFSCGLTTMIGSSNDLGQVVNSVNTFSGLVPLYPIGMMSTTAGYEGRHGHLTDQWFVPSGVPSGSTIEEDASSPTFEIAVFANMAIPWNGVPPEVS